MVDVMFALLYLERFKLFCLNRRRRSGVRRWRRWKAKPCRSPNLAEVERQEETMSVVALVATQFMMLNVDDEYTNATLQKAKQQTWSLKKGDCLSGERNERSSQRQADGDVGPK